MKRYSVAFEIMIVLTVILLIVGVGLPQFNKAKDRAKESEAKSNIHAIQLAIEKYAVDHESQYPEYLIGGDRKIVAPSQKEGDPGSTGDEKTKPMFVSDPLLRNGYLLRYPSNPFVSKKNASDVADLQAEAGDPLRNGATKEEREGVAGNRFGIDGTLMGNVSCDYRYPKTTFTRNRETGLYQTYADFDGYLFYDVWQGEEPKSYLPGEIMYKANGWIIKEQNAEFYDNTPPIPIEVDQYILGVFGSPRKKGFDILGPEPMMRACPSEEEERKIREGFGPEADGADFFVEFHTWTRWTQEQDSNGNYLGSPYNEGDNSGLEQLGYGNPNGIKDAICFLVCERADVRINGYGVIMGKKNAGDK